VGVAVFLETFSFIKRNPFMFMLMVALSCAILAYNEYSVGKYNSARYFVTFYFAYYVQNEILNGLPPGSGRSGGKMPGLGGFFWKNILLMLAAMAIGFGIPLAWGAHSFSPVSFVFLCTVLTSVSYALILALVGTWPTARIAGSTTGLVDAFGRGRRKVLPTFFRLFAALVLPVVAIAALAAAVSLSGYKVDNLVDDGRLNIVHVALVVVSKCLETIGICYMSIVLARKLQTSDAARYREWKEAHEDGVLGADEVSAVFREYP
jgi:hypothetical protein